MKKKTLKKRFKKTEKVVEEKDLKKNNNWTKTFWTCIHFTKNSYRQLDGSGHAICNDKGVCRVHYDRANPLNHPIRHILYDTPYRVAFTALYPIFIIDELRLKYDLKHQTRLRAVSLNSNLNIRYRKNIGIKEKLIDLKNKIF